jgi:hypothetical protein
LVTEITNGEGVGHSSAGAPASGGEVAGSIIGALVGAGLIAGVLFYFYSRRMKYVGGNASATATEVSVLQTNPIHVDAGKGAAFVRGSVTEMRTLSISTASMGNCSDNVAVVPSAPPLSTQADVRSLQEDL